jgi:hypothetical protein
MRWEEKWPKTCSNVFFAFLTGTAMTDSDLDRILSIIRRCHK